ncbi:uncharacterized protein MYCGRDRAFT_110580 [Zymoseptoria tritici IPO323]|uniref:Uncharacterized protein n=1 Tax=Zymoseptoria tritici (strain CBS 115943 / IPO323) TaxID=336722 RepID=F9XIR5_ZYMTI|nr:uncharacterized protein MYCGRDRAFT_110580 [Zymoseptoria tritici IPO323]EGP85118.1 hypothetical protein MYCGRDRAFT_110580 [Zymoseptoria tritici IPO323]
MASAAGDNIMSGINISKEITCQIVDNLMGPRPDSRYNWPVEALADISSTVRQDLAHARLINKAFCDCVTPLLFRDIKAYFPYPSPELKPSVWAKDILKLSSSRVAGHVKRLEIGFLSWPRTTDPPEFFLEEVLLEALYAIPALVSACRGLRILKIEGSPRDRDDAPVLSQLHRRMFNQCIDQVFRILSQGNDYTGPKAILMSLPLAHDYGQRYSRSLEFHSGTYTNPLTQVLESIHRLEVTISDVTGSGGQRYWPRSESAGHARHPNIRHQSELWEFIGLAKQLRVLTIQCSHVLNFDNFPVDGLQHLRELGLIRVSMSETQWSKLLDRTRSSLKAMELTLVDLTSGTWESCLLQLCTMSHLDHFFIDSCGYTANGASSQHALGLLPAPDEQTNIETMHFTDENALGHVQRHVNAVRQAAGMDLYDETYYRYLSSRSLEEEGRLRIS